MDLTTFTWTRPPRHYTVTRDQVEITTEPGTDLWQRTYYHFRNDNAPVLQTRTRDQYFSFIVKASFDTAQHRFDQCGVAVYLDSNNWIKGSIEYENKDFQHLGSVVTNGGYSDWATTEIPAATGYMWYRLSRRGQDFRIENSLDGTTWHQMRICHLADAGEEISFGVYACSPEDSSFTAVFTNFELTDCAWQPHEGQQPDKK
ncbi:DUF1349 domain-containing protein [Rothia nasisuis]|uniref:DUF1349 domain-containing protein n=1 Tax=Rothia nasisuis TaxID=2109647 RepID=UPI001F407878|nr:DUF1349 domain-containing protein [Rothia nasisuis]